MVARESCWRLIGVKASAIGFATSKGGLDLCRSMGGAGGLYLVGLTTHNSHLAESGRGKGSDRGWLAVVEALKLASNRQRSEMGTEDSGPTAANCEADGFFPRVTQ